MNDTNEWSFSLWDESLDFEELYKSESESETTICQEYEKPPKNQYNPFILCKMNSFKKKRSLKLFTKCMKVKSNKILKSPSPSSLNWDFEHRWIQRRGFPSEVLIEGFCKKIGTQSYQLFDSSLKEWYIISNSRK